MSVATELRVLPTMELTFPVDLPGLKGVRHFRLEPLGDGTRTNPFGRLVALESVLLGDNTLAESMRLVVAAPGLLWPDFAVAIDDAIEVLLEIEDPRDVAVVVVITLRDTFERSTANLLAPIVINTRKLLATQIVPLNLDEVGGLSINAPLPVAIEKG